MAEPNGYIQGSSGVSLELVDKTARRQLVGKLDAPGDVKAGDYLIVKNVGVDGTVVLGGADAPGEGSGQNQDYTALTNKPSINGVTLEGNKTAEELGLTAMTDAQVSSALGKYVEEHPDSLTTGATPEQATVIRRFENLGFNDPMAYGNLLDTSNMMLNNTGTPKAGVDVFDLAAKWNPASPWRFMFFPVEAGGKYTVVSAKLPALSDFRAVSRDGIVLEGVPAVGKNPWTVTADSAKGVSYQTLTIPDDWPSDGYYLMLQLAYGTDNTDFDTLMVFRGEYSDYQGYAPYNPELGTAKSDRLRVTEQNLTDAMLNKLNRGGKAVQAEDLESTPYAWNTLRNFESYPAPRLDDWAIGEAHRLFNSARIAGADLDTQIQIGSHYAHAPTMEIIGDTAYIAAFQNAVSTVDDFKLTTVELWRVDLANWTVLEQLNVASAGLPCGSDTLSIGGGDPNILNIGDTTLRIVFTTQLSDGIYRICYRDYDVASGTLGEIGVCKISNGTDTYDFDINGIKSVCGAFAATNPTINMATQYATHNGEHYIGLGVDAVYPNIPILKTSDFITFTHWATPTVEGNAAHYECACVTITGAAGDKTLYTATRQTGQNADTLLIMAVRFADAKVLKYTSIPSGNARPFWWIGSDGAYLFHANQTPQIRETSSIARVNANAVEQVGTVADTVAMIYPCAREYNGELVVAYMRKTRSLHLSRIPKLPLYSFRDVIPILNKILDYFGDGSK